MLTGFAALGAGWALPRAGRAHGGRDWLELRSLHTDEECAAPLRDAEGNWLDTSFARFDWLLRDHRNDAVCAMSRPLLQQLVELAALLGVEARYEVISGYRSPQTNAALRSAGRGVAEHSLHTQGMAIDVRLRGVACAELRDAALLAARGGVGYYARPEFVHLDVGRVRAWTG
ncbi:MAG: DUF882 domain-containing protein [Gammaproteobacteria bacterium]|nr:DUF882 domain-containing protein [Gammaproteobacteria bacterium]